MAETRRTDRERDHNVPLPPDAARGDGGSTRRRVVELARERLPDDVLVENFVSQYYRELPSVDLDDRGVGDLLAVALAHLALGRARPWGETRVEVLSPDRDIHGWHSPRSVLLLVTDDAPFLVDTVRMVLDRRGLPTHLLVHPMLAVHRDADGQLLRCVDVSPGAPRSEDAGAHVEAWTQVEIDRCDPALAATLAAEVRAVVEEVHRIVADFGAMRSWMAELVDEDPLLDWLVDGNFVFLGAATYDRTEDGGLVVRPGTELGQLRRPHPIDPAPVPVEISEQTPVVVSRSDAVSDIHRPARRTCISVRAGGGARHRFLGLLASSAYRQSVLQIPVIGDRVRSVLGLTGEVSSAYSARAARNVLETLPRDLLFELDADALAHLTIDVVGLQERQLVRVFDVPEPVGDNSTIMVYLPRSRFHAQLPEIVASAIGDAYASVPRDVESLVGQSSLARITCTVTRPSTGSPDLDQLVARIDELTTSWTDRVTDALIGELGEHEGRRLAGRHLESFPVDYRAHVGPARAVSDVLRIDELLDSGRRLATSLGRDAESPAGDWRFRVYHRDEPLTLSALLPMLGHLGLETVDERPTTLVTEGVRVHVYDIGIRLPAGIRLDQARVGEIRATFEGLVLGEVEADGLNRLVTLAGLDRRQVAVLRTFVRYLRQTAFSFSLAYVEETLARLPLVARGLVELFRSRFDPAVVDRDAALAAARSSLDDALDEIQMLDDDRICRALVGLIDATVRTNAFLDRIPIAIKLDPQRIADLPRPRPAVEVFVCSPDVEGVHMRAGPIARGGLRWSDRREDFRTEVLGLVKAQIVKNAVIVPVGAKGGFIVKRSPEAPADLRDHVTECYREFIRSLLDLTDDVTPAGTVTRSGVVAHDDLDPYLVVAADKGTATFSDVANAVAEEYGFWLGDAFASGGSNGYDHKAMGITARGAWESVRRHARVIGLDVETDPLTVVGIGDMSGDVFGNGLLRSPHLRLIAAFDHRHVFIDPDPDPAVSFAERQRLFALPRSSWADYDLSLISAGGGVHPRSVKSITLSPEAQAALGTSSVHVSPPELIRIILRAPVDLLWNGGIGTYVKASTEAHAEVGDRANDAVRVDGRELRCRIVGEGGNLGLTQLGRIEFALAGGLVNTDAIDNSAGVDCSDHEVNIKILLDGLVTDGRLTIRQRNELLAEMADEVAELVLDNNRAQSLALVIARRQAAPMANVHARYLDLLEAEGWLDRELEFLPTDKQISERQANGQGLVTPEFAVLIAYTKNADIIEVLGSDVPDEPLLQADLVGYFPTPLRERFGDAIRAHRLRREIIATQLVNQMVNLAGISFDHRMTEDTGASTPDVVRAWLAAREILSLPARWAEVDELGSGIHLDTRLDLFLDLRRAAERCSRWFLRRRRPPLDLAATIEMFGHELEAFAEGLGVHLRGAMADATAAAEQRRLDAGVPADLARRAAVWPLLHTCLDVVDLARRLEVPPARGATTYWEVFDRLELMWLWTGVGSLPRADRWQTQARSVLRDDLLEGLYGLVSTVTTEADGSVEDWLEANARAVGRATSLFAQIRRADSYDLTNLSVALRQLRNLGLVSVHRAAGQGRPVPEPPDA